ncbi:hypothetical protein MRB53_026340 [Persea americana]|uniref:Uncharacterized protein n=1 Tax=Persea americana TaxID=3435 RepID=A0ACC2LHV2_PERAE|nr:hypothetical protein MRB53_026340 [Persea americana]
MLREISTNPPENAEPRPKSNKSSSKSSKWASPTTLHLFLQSFPSQGDLYFASLLLTLIDKPNSSIYHSMIRVFAASSDPKHALLFHLHMRCKNPISDKFTLPLVLKGHGLRCSVSRRIWHSSAWEDPPDGFLTTPLSQVAWSKCIHNSAMSTSLSSHFAEGLQVFKEMVGEEVSPNQAALVNVLSSRAHLRRLNMGFGFMDHGYIEKHGIELDDILDASPH